MIFVRLSILLVFMVLLQSILAHYRVRLFLISDFGLAHFLRTLTLGFSFTTLLKTKSNLHIWLPLVILRTLNSAPLEYRHPRDYQYSFTPQGLHRGPGRA